MDNKRKLEISQLKNYLGTGLKVQVERESGELDEIELTPNQLVLLNENYHFDPKLKCYRLHDLDKHIPELGFVPIEELLRIRHRKWFEDHEGTKYAEIETKSVPNFINAYFKFQATFEIRIWIKGIFNEEWWIVQKLFEWNFWPFGDEYFTEGLAIDKLKQP